jgi:hypothetical protein
MQAEYAQGEPVSVLFQFRNDRYWCNDVLHLCNDV